MVDFHHLYTAIFLLLSFSTRILVRYSKHNGGKGQLLRKKVCRTENNFWTGSLVKEYLKLLHNKLKMKSGSTSIREGRQVIRQVYVCLEIVKFLFVFLINGNRI